MSLRTVRFVVILSIIAGSSTSKAFAQNVPASRDFDAEIEAALRSAKTATNAAGVTTTLKYTRVE